LKDLRDKAKKVVEKRGALEDKVLKENILDSGNNYIQPEDAEKHINELSDIYKKNKNTHGITAEAALVGMKKQILFEKLSTEKQQELKVKEKMEDNFESFVKYSVIDLEKNKGKTLGKLRKVMEEYKNILHDDRLWKVKPDKKEEIWKDKPKKKEIKEEIAKNLENFNTIEDLKNDVKNIFKSLTGRYPKSYENLKDLLKETMKVLVEKERLAALKRKNVSGLKLDDYRTALEEIQKHGEEENLKPKIYDKLKSEVEDIFKKMTGRDPTRTESFQDVLKQTFDVLEKTDELIEDQKTAEGLEYYRTKLGNMEEEYEKKNSLDLLGKMDIN